MPCTAQVCEANARDECDYAWPRLRTIYRSVRSARRHALLYACVLAAACCTVHEPLLLRSKLKDIKLRETKRKINVSARHDSVSATPRSGRSASSAAASHDRAVGRAPIAFALPAGIVCPAGSPDRSTDPACAQLSLARTVWRALIDSQSHGTLLAVFCSCTPCDR